MLQLSFIHIHIRVYMFICKIYKEMFFSQEYNWCDFYTSTNITTHFCTTPTCNLVTVYKFALIAA